MYQVFRVERLKNLSQLRHTLSWKFLQALGIDSDTLVSWSREWRMENKITRSVSRMTQTLKPLNPKFKMFRDFES